MATGSDNGSSGDFVELARLVRRARGWLLFYLALMVIGLVSMFAASATSEPGPNGTSTVTGWGVGALLGGLAFAVTGGGLMWVYRNRRPPTRSSIAATKRQLETVRETLDTTRASIEQMVALVEGLDELSQRLQAEQKALAELNAGQPVPARALSRLSGARSRWYDIALLVAGGVLGVIGNWVANPALSGLANLLKGF